MRSTARSSCLNRGPSRLRSFLRQQLAPRPTQMSSQSEGVTAPTEKEGRGESGQLQAPADRRSDRIMTGGGPHHVASGGFTASWPLACRRGTRMISVDRLCLDSGSFSVADLGIHEKRSTPGFSRRRDVKPRAVRLWSGWRAEIKMKAESGTERSR